MEFKLPSEKLHFLEKIDIFGIYINIRFNKNSVHKTKIGGLVTLVVAGVLIYLIKLIIDNLQDTQNPIVLYEQRFTPQPEIYYLSKDKFIMTFGMQNSLSQHYIDPSVYTATLLIKQITKVKDPETGLYTPNQSTRVVKTEPCTLSHFNITRVNSYFTSLSYQNMYCISNDETDLYLEGEFDALNYSTLELKVEACQTSSCNPNMNSILTQGRLAIYYVDYQVIPSDKDNPFQPLGRQSFWISGPEFTKQTNINFRNSYLYSDYGKIGTDIHTDRILTFSYDREQVTPKSGNLLYDCYISFEKNIDSTYNRSYQKLDKSLSQLGGMFNILFTFGALLCRPLSQIELNLKLINRLFQFEDNNNEKKSQSPDKQELEMKLRAFSKRDENMNTEEITNQDLFQSEVNRQLKSKFLSPLQNCQKTEIDELTSKQRLSTPVKRTISLSKEKHSLMLQKRASEEAKSNTKQNEKNKKANELMSIFNFASNKISFSGWEYYTNFFKFSKLCKRRHQLLQKGVDRLYNQIDIFFLIEKMLEIEKLKRLLLNENQIKLFEFIPKPVLSLEEKKLTHVSQKVGILYEKTNDINKCTAEAQQAFSSLIHSQHKPSKIDIRIMDLLDPHFKKFMQSLGGGVSDGGIIAEGVGDLSTQNRINSNFFDLNKGQIPTQKDMFQDEMQVATEGIPFRLRGEQDSSTLIFNGGLYSSNTKPNQTQLINL